MARSSFLGLSEVFARPCLAWPIERLPADPGRRSRGDGSAKAV